MGNNPKFRFGIRIVAGCYLIYLAYQIIRDGLIGGGMTGGNRYVGIIGSAAFIIIGLGLAIKSSRDMMAFQKEENALAAQEAAAEAAQDLEEVQAIETQEEETEDSTEEEAEDVPEEETKDVPEKEQADEAAE